MAKLVNLPNGKQGSFPDDMSWEQVQSVIQKQFPPQTKEANVKSVPESEGATLVQPSAPEQTENPYMSSSDEKKLRRAYEQSKAGYDRGLGFAQGTLNAIPGVANLGIKGYNALTGNKVQEYKGFHFAPKTHEADIGELASWVGPGALGKILGKIPQVAAVPEHIQKIPMIADMIKNASNVFSKAPSAVKTGSKVLGNIGKGAAQGAIYSPEDQGLGALLGGAGSAAGMGLSAGLGKVFGKEPGRETLENLKPEDVQASTGAAQRLGTPLTPAEASQNPFIAGQQGRYMRTSEAAYENVKSGLERKGKEKEAVNNLLTTIYDKSTASKNKISNLYGKAYQWNMKPEIVSQLKSDPIMADAFNDVAKDPAWQRKMKDIPENNFAYLDKVRKSIGDTENKLLRAGEKSKAAEYTEARNSLADLMDNASPAYKQARAEAQKSIIRSQIEKKMRKKELSGSEFYKKIIDNDQEFQKTLKGLKNVPEAQQQLRDMQSAWHSLVNVEKPSTASYQSEKSLNQARSSLEKALQLWNQLTGKKKNLESVKFIRNMDQWTQELHNAQLSGKKSNVENKLSDIMSKAFPATYNIGKEEFSE